MLILEGSSRIENPTFQDVERELQRLADGGGDAVVLSCGEEFIQAMQHDQPSYLRVEARALAGAMDGRAMYQMYEQAYPATYGSAVELFNTFLDRKSFRIDSSWKTHAGGTVSVSRKKNIQAGLVIITAVAVMLLIGGVSLLVYLVQLKTP